MSGLAGSTNSIVEASSSEAPPSKMSYFTHEQVAQHCTRDSCWSIYNGRVYDLTKFIDLHPGGTDSILDGAGGDVTQRFNDVHDYNGPKMDKYCIGMLDPSSAASASKPATAATADLKSLIAATVAKTAPAAASPAPATADIKSMIAAAVAKTAPAAASPAPATADIKSMIAAAVAKTAPVAAAAAPATADIKSMIAAAVASSTSGSGQQKQQQQAPQPVDLANLPVYTREQVAQHHTRDDCWSVYAGRVYDLTAFIDLHPGGDDTIMEGAGEDVTQRFNDVHDYNGPKMDKYCVGVLDPASAAAPPPVPAPAAPVDLKSLIAATVAKTAPGAASAAPAAIDIKSMIAAEVAKTAPAAAPPPAAGSDASKTWMDVKLVSRRTVARDTDVFRLALPDPQARLSLPIGQHILVSVPTPDGKSVMKPYTPIAEKPGFVDMLIKVYRPTPSFPSGGVVSQAIFALNLGDSVRLQGPKGSFMYSGNGQYTKAGKQGRADNMAFIAGGTGITPVYQVLRAVLSDASDPTRITLLYANQDEGAIALKAELEALASQHAGRFKMVHVLSRVQAASAGHAAEAASLTIATTTTATTSTTSTTTATAASTTSTSTTTATSTTITSTATATSAPAAPASTVIHGRLSHALMAQHLPAVSAASACLAGVCGPPGLISEVALPGLQALGYAREAIVVF